MHLQHLDVQAGSGAGPGGWNQGTLAVFSGSSSSGGGGVRAVLMAQKRQPRVQVSPAGGSVSQGLVGSLHCSMPGM